MTKMQALKLVESELARAVRKHLPYHSVHEGWAVIWEELDELWDEVRKRRSARNKTAMRHEAAQVAACAIRFMQDLL